MCENLIILNEFKKKHLRKFKIILKQFWEQFSQIFENLISSLKQFQIFWKSFKKVLKVDKL